MGEEGGGGKCAPFYSQRFRRGGVGDISEGLVARLLDQADVVEWAGG